MTSRLLELILRTTKQGDDLSKTSAQLGEFKKGIGGAVQELTGLNLTSIGVAGAITAVAAGLKKAVDSTIEYAEQVRDLSRISGASAEETSRLIQTADDLKVEYSTLQQAAKALAQDGIALTTEELAKSADEYIKITDAGERAEYATKKYGRAGLELTKILEVGGDALRQMAKEQNSGLILTNQQVKAARDFEIAQDNLSDTVQALTISLGVGLLPVLVKVLDAFNSLITSGQRTKDEIANITNNNVALGGSYEDVRARMVSQLEAAGYLVGKYDEIRTKGGQVIEGAHILSQAEYDVAAAFAENNKQIAEAPARFDDYSLAAANAVTPTNNAAEALRAVNLAMGEMTKQKLFEEAAAGMAAPDRLSLARAMGMIDESAYKAYKKVQDLNTQFKQGKIDAYNMGFEVLGISNALEGLDGKTFTAKLNILYQEEMGPHESIPVPKLSPIDAGDGMASGGSFVIPPGYPNDSYPLGAGHWGQSGERVTVTPAPTNYNANFSGNVTIMNGTDVASLAKQLQQHWQRMSRY